MEISFADYFPVALGTVFALIWLLLHIKYRKAFSDVIDRLDDKAYPLSEIFYIGFGVFDLFKIDFSSATMQAKAAKLLELYDVYAGFYYYVICAQKITYILTALPLLMFLAAIGGEPVLALLGIAAPILLALQLDEKIKNDLERKRDQIESDFPMMLSTLALLVNAGVVMRDAWIKVSVTGDRALYAEMQKVSEEMQNGVSLPDAITAFSKRCSSREIKKFASAIIQNLQKGSSELSKTLRDLSRDSWFERKHTVRRKGELANQKMLMPTVLMFIGVLGIILVPIVFNML